MTERPAILNTKLQKVSEGALLFAKELEEIAEREAEATGDQVPARRAKAAREFAAYVEAVEAESGSVGSIEGVDYPA